MNVHCMSRAEALKLFRKMPAHTKRHYACISISNTWDPPISHAFFPRYTLSLDFDDVDVAASSTYPLLAMTESQADEIALFVHAMNNDLNISDMVVHCEAGLSRSAGIVAAIDEWLGNTCASPDERRKPNIWCYRLVSQALRQSPKQLLAKALVSESDWCRWVPSPVVCAPQSTEEE